jgi:LDH2 family malate/lactate/ureidoglycolate dehydrogenase
LGSIVDIFSAVLSGANFGPWAPPFVSFLPMPENPVGEGLGHFLGAMRIDGFKPTDKFKENMDVWIERFRSAKTTPESSKVIIPGDPEREMEAERKVNGIPINDKVVIDLKEVANRFELSF